MSKPQVLTFTSFVSPLDPSIVMDRSMFSSNKAFLNASKNTSHGHSSDTVTGKKTSEYYAWTNMRTRCFNEKYSLYHRYGGRGITVCARWMVFANFLADMGRKPHHSYQLDRRNNDGNYEPGNCEWVTTDVQNHNRSNSRFIEIDGMSKSLQAWAIDSGVRWKTIWRRLRDGWAPRDAVFMRCTSNTTPYRKRRKSRVKIPRCGGDR